MNETSSYPPDYADESEQRQGQQQEEQGHGGPQQEEPPPEDSALQQTADAAHQRPPDGTEPLNEEGLAPFTVGFPDGEIPAFDWGMSGVFACVVNLDQLAQWEIGFGIDDPGFPEALAEVVQGAEECASVTPEFGEEQFQSVMEAGRFAWNVAAIRDRFGVDLAAIRDGYTREWSSALAQRMADRGVTLPPQPPPEDPQAEATRRVMSWLPLAQLGGRLNLSTQTTEGLEYLRGAVDWVSQVRCPPTTQDLSQINGYAASLAAVRQHLNVDPTANGAWAAVQQMRARAEEVATRARDTLAGLQQRGQEIRDRAVGMGAMVGERGVAAARNIAHGAASRIMQGLPTSPDQVPVLQRAMPVLATAASIRQATGRSPIRRRSTAPRRTGNRA